MHEEPLCFISLGTMLAYKAGPRRPATESYVSELGQGMSPHRRIRSAELDLHRACP
jgi:hypothetical protein